MDEQRLAQNPFENLHLKIQEPALLPRIIPLRVVEQMLSAAHQAMQRQPAGRALCETAVMETLFATGMRVSELSGLKAREIDLKDGVIRILGKGSKECILHITNAEVLAVLRQYAECGPSRDGTFFHSRDGGRLSEQSIRNIVQIGRAHV